MTGLHDWGGAPLCGLRHASAVAGESTGRSFCSAMIDASLDRPSPAPLLAQLTGPPTHRQLTHRAARSARRAPPRASWSITWACCSLRAAETRRSVGRPNNSARSVGFGPRGDSKSPANYPLSRRVPGVFVQRERSGGLGNDFTSASPASIDAGMERRLSGPVFLVELRTDADFYVIAAPEECHGSLSFADLAQAIALSPAERRGIPHK
jgi:hypothetical protein